MPEKTTEILVQEITAVSTQHQDENSCLITSPSKWRVAYFTMFTHIEYQAL